MASSQSLQDTAQKPEEKDIAESLSSLLPPPVSTSPPVILPQPPVQEDVPPYYDVDPPEGSDSAFIAPFQPSGATPSVDPHRMATQQHSVPFLAKMKVHKKRGLSTRSWFLLTSVALVVLGLLLLQGVVQTTLPVPTQSSRTSRHLPAGAGTVVPQPGATLPTATRTLMPTSQIASDWLPLSLPNGWTQAGLLTGDALEALRTAVAFNDREMSLDYRSVGTRTIHGGTFTAALFLLSAAAKQRFAQNDVRLIDNTLFDMVQKTHLVRVVINPYPQLVKVAQQGTQQFAWVDVAFQLWQSQNDPATSMQHLEGKELDPTTQQPRLFHMLVLLLRVPSQEAGATPPMGGTGWLVSTYALNPSQGVLPDILQPA